MCVCVGGWGYSGKVGGWGGIMCLDLECVYECNVGGLGGVNVCVCACVRACAGMCIIYMCVDVMPWRFSGECVWEWWWGRVGV